MATIKVFSVEGVKEINCFDTLENVPYLLDDSMSDEEMDEVADILSMKPI